MKQLFQSFMITYSRDTKRLDNFKHFKSIFDGMLEMFEAVDCINNYDYYKNFALKWDTVTQGYIDDIEIDQKKALNQKRLNGKLGCNLSHIFLLEFINQMDFNIDWFLIMEDDTAIVYSQDICNYLNSLIDQAQNHQFINLYIHNRFKSRQFHDSRKISSTLYRMLGTEYRGWKYAERYLWGTVAYLISKQGINTVLDHLPIDCNMDEQYGRLSQKLNAVIAKPTPFSTIGSRDSADDSSPLGSLIWGTALM